MRRIVIISLLYCSFHCSLDAQNQPPQYVHWDARFGGPDEDWLSKVYKLPDGGFVLEGLSRSGQEGNKSAPSKGGGDYWLIRIDSLGNKLWDRTYGTTGDDISFSMTLTHDGGFLLAGHTGAGVNGDKTEPSRGNTDYWVIRVDSLGNKLWDKTFGGNSEEVLYDVISCSDGGFVLVGRSNSNASGDKSEDNDGLECGWVVKIDSLGNKQWDQTFKNGGNAWVLLSSGIETTDGGFIFGGRTDQSAQNDVTITGYGSVDYWVIKTDALGNTLWDKRYGGNYGDDLFLMTATQNGGAVLAGISTSGISGNKIVSKEGYWILKINSIGGIVWQTAFTYAGYDPLGLVPTLDGGFLFSTYASFSILDDKTEQNLGNGQTWIVKIDSLGNKVWDKTIFTIASNAGYAIEDEPGCYVIGTGSKANAGGYKSQDNWDTTQFWNDIWILKLCEEPLGIEEPTKSFATLYPNPTTGTLHIETASPIGHIVLYNLLGGEVLAQPLTQPHNTLDVSVLPQGVYLYRIEVEGQVQTGKVVVQ